MHCCYRLHQLNLCERHRSCAQNLASTSVQKSRSYDSDLEREDSFSVEEAGPDIGRTPVLHGSGDTDCWA